MAARQIHLSSDARQVFRIVLGGQSLRINIWWQGLTGGWYLSLSWLDGRKIVSGCRLVGGGRPLDGKVVNFAGELAVVGNDELGRDAWNVSHRLLYIEP